MNTPTTQRLTFGQKFGYGIGDYAFNLMFQGVGLFLFYYYTNVMGLSPLQAGFIFLVARVWDGITDPMMGYWANKTRSRWGKYRPYLLWGSLPVCLVFISCFYNIDGGNSTKFWFALVTHVGFTTAYTVISMPYTALSAELTSDSQERASVAGFRMIFATLGGLTVAALTKPLVEKFAQPSEGYLTIASGYGLVAFLLFLACFGVVREKNATSTDQLQGFSLSATMQMIRQNTPFMLLCGGVICFSATLTMFLKVIQYYFEYNLSQPKKIESLALLTTLGTTVFAVPIWVAIAKYIDKRNTLIAGGLCIILASALLAMFDKTQLSLIFLTLVLFGFGFGSFAFSGWAMLPDTVEFGEWKTGIRAEGVIFGLYSFAQKVALGVGVGILGLLLSAFGYQSPQEGQIISQTPDALAGIRFILTVVSSLGAVAGILFIYFYPINYQNHAQMLQAIQQTKQPSV
ncbi:MAG TPA: hypothetical protein DCM08_08205 [Microscillaceae bacterium]|jgi:GPH family glycoside/pentoside/hexuronide:cation symporter|nr:hypothetical protein [Microscillaceae bacterium]